MAKRKAKFKKNTSKKKKSSNSEYTSIKVGFKKILRKTKNSKKIRKEISERSVKATKFSVLSSLLILYEINNAVNEQENAEIIEFERTFFNQNVSKYILTRFRSMTQDNSLQNNVVYDDFSNLLLNFGIEKPETIAWGNSFVYNYEQYETCWSTHINVHAKNRFIKYFKCLVDDFTMKDIKDTATFIFNVKSRVSPNTELLNHLNLVGIVPEPEDQLEEEEENSESDDSMSDLEDANSLNSSDSENSDNFNDMGPVNHIFAGFTRGFFKRRLNAQWFKTIPAFIRMQRAIDHYNRNMENEYRLHQQQEQQRKLQLAQQHQQQLEQQQQEPPKEKRIKGRKVNKVS